MAESPSSSPAPIAEIDHGPSKLDQFLDAHTKKLIIGVILIVLGVIGYVVYNGLAEAEAQDAGSALLKAEKAADYQDVIQKWPKSHAAASALPLLAEAQWSASQSDALQTLQDFISNHPEHPSVATAKVSLGLRLLEQGKVDEATEALTEVLESDSATYIAPLACIALGDIAKAGGKADEAKTWYEKALEDPSEQGNTFKDTAEARLRLVNAKPPTKIKPALPTPPVPPAPGLPKASDVTPATSEPAAPSDSIPAPVLETPDTPTPPVTPEAPPATEAPETPKIPAP